MLEQTSYTAHRSSMWTLKKPIIILKQKIAVISNYSSCIEELFLGTCCKDVYKSIKIKCCSGKLVTPSCCSLLQCTYCSALVHLFDTSATLASNKWWQVSKLLFFFSFFSNFCYCSDMDSVKKEDFQVTLED